MKPLLALLLLTSPVVAQCVSTSDIAQSIKESGGAVLAGATYAGLNSDTSILAAVEGSLWLVAFKDGCFVTKISLDTIVSAAPAVEPGVGL